MRSFFINYQKFSYGDQNQLAFISEQFTYLAFWWYELGAEMKSAMYYNTWGVMLCWDFWSTNAGILIHFMHNFVGGKILQCKSFESVNQSLEIAFSTPTTCTASQKLFVFWNIIPTLLHFLAYIQHRYTHPWSLLLSDYLLPLLYVELPVRLLLDITHECEFYLNLFQYNFLKFWWAWMYGCIQFV